MTLKFGYCLPVFASPGEHLFRTPNYPKLNTSVTLQLGQLADTLGYDSLWVADHLMLGRDEAILEGWTVLAALAGSTRNALLGLIHQAHPFRHPALAAKMVATLDQISGGRFIYFLDCGRKRDEYLAYGLPWDDDLDVRVEQMIEGLELSLALWVADAPISFAGKYYRLNGAVCRPSPVQKPYPPVWLGEADEAILRACARLTQGWNSVSVPMTELERRLAALEAACQLEHRPSEELEKSLEIQILIARDRQALRDSLGQMMMLFAPQQQASAEIAAFVESKADELPATMLDTWLVGTPDEVVLQFQKYLDLGITHFMLWFVDAPDEEGMRLFADEVMPRFK